MIPLAPSAGARIPHRAVAPANPLLWDTLLSAPAWTISSAGARGQIGLRPAGPNGWGAVGKAFKSTGKWYFEVLASANTTASAPTEAVFGLVDSTWIADARTAMHTVTNAWALARDGVAWHNSASNTPDINLPLYNSTPSVIMVALDLDAHKVWFGRAGVWPTYSSVVANPATGVLPALSSLAGSISIGAVGNATVDNQLDFRIRSFLADFTHTPPSGFLPWDNV